MNRTLTPLPATQKGGRTPAAARRMAALASTALLALLAACGGAEPPASEADGRATIASAATSPIPTLLADDGSAMPSMPQAVPRDAGARTRAGRYASPAQAEQLERAMAASLVRVTLRGSGLAAVEEGAGLVYGLLAAMNLPDSAPVLIEGADLRAAAALVDRLAANGVTNTWLVTQ